MASLRHRAETALKSMIRRSGPPAGVLRSRILGALATAALVIGLSGLGRPAVAASFLEKNFWLSGPRYDAIVPSCDQPEALGKIASDFSQKETQFWNSLLVIRGFERVREVGFRTGVVDAIPRRYCTGTVLVSDGHKRRVNYWIGEDTGIIGATWGVQWCVVGLDRNMAYGPSCRAALP